MGADVMANPQKKYSDIPDGAEVVHDPAQAQGSSYSDLPTGATVVPNSQPAEKPGFFKRLGQSLGVPTSMNEVNAMQAKEDALPWYQKIIPHAPGQTPTVASALLGPGASAAADMASNYGKTAYRGITQGGQQLAETSGQVGRGEISMPQAFAKSADAGLHMALQATPIIGPAIDTAGQDIGPMPEGHFLYNPEGNYKGAAGGLTGVVGQVAAPELIKRAPTAVRGITQSISEAAPNLSAKVGATAKLVGQDALSHIPIAGRVVRRPSFMDYVEAAKTEADPQLDLFNSTPKLGDSPLAATNPDAARPTPAEPTGIVGPRIPQYMRTGSESLPAELPPRAEPSGEWNPESVPRGITQAQSPEYQAETLDKANQLNNSLAESRAARGITQPQISATVAQPAPAAVPPSIEVPPNPDAYYGHTPPENLVPQHQRQMARGVTQEPAQPPQASQIFTEEPKVPAPDEDLSGQLQRSIDMVQAAKAKRGITQPQNGGSAAVQEQGGHAGNSVTSVEELNRSGTNYTVSKGGQVSYHGKSFAPESTPNGASHVTVLPDGTFRINAGQKLTAGQELALRNALKK